MVFLIKLFFLEYEEEYEDEDDITNIEPLIKYTRLRGYTSKILSSHDTFTCFAISIGYIYLGTNYGVIYILTEKGDSVNTVRVHKGKINCLDIDSKGEYLVSGGDDGQVVIIPIKGGEQLILPHSQPIYSVAIDPLYSTSKENILFCGGKKGKITMNKKSWIGQKDKAIQQGEGAIHAIAYKGYYLGWANERGIRIYDVNKDVRIGGFEKENNIPDINECKAYMYWESEISLVTAWYKTIKIIKINERPSIAGAPPQLFPEVIKIIKIDSGIILGIGPFDADHFILLVQSYNEDNIKDKIELRIISRIDGEEISADSFAIKGYEKNKNTDYMLCYNSNINTNYTIQYDTITSEKNTPVFYIVSPQDIIIAQRRQLIDHIQFSLENKDYEHSLQLAQQYSDIIKPEEASKIKESYLNNLIQNNEYEKAATLCPKLLNSAELWGKWIIVYAQAKKLPIITPYVPTVSPILSHDFYELILDYFLENDVNEFLRLLKTWPRPPIGKVDKGLYDVQKLIKKVEEKIKTNKKASLLESVAELYSMNVEYEKALRVYLDTGCKGLDPVYIIIF